MFSTRWLPRACVVVAVASAATLGVASPGWTQTRASGGVTVFDAVDCPGGGNAAKVVVPFSIRATGLEPFSHTSVLFITDKDAHPNVTYGPIMIEDVDAQGEACADVVQAEPGQWKIDVVEEDSGFTDSKVVTILGESEAPTTTTSTTTIPSVTTTIPPSSTTLPSISTTTSSTTLPSSSTTTTTEPPATSTTTTSPATVHRPGSELPWTIVFVAQSERPTSTLPRTGGDGVSLVIVAAGLVVVGVALLLARRR